MQLKPIRATSHLRYYCFPLYLQRQKGSKRGDWLLCLRKSWLHPSGAKMVRRLMLMGGDAQESNRPVQNQPTQPQLLA